MCVSVCNALLLWHSFSHSFCFKILICASCCPGDGKSANDVPLTLSYTRWDANMLTANWYKIDVNNRITWASSEWTRYNCVQGKVGTELQHGSQWHTWKHTVRVTRGLYKLFLYLYRMSYTEQFGGFSRWGFIHYSLKHLLAEFSWEWDKSLQFSAHIHILQ